MCKSSREAIIKMGSFACDRSDTLKSESDAVQRVEETKRSRIALLGRNRKLIEKKNTIEKNLTDDR